jgi:hypothetical protein
MENATFLARKRQIEAIAQKSEKVHKHRLKTTPLSSSHYTITMTVNDNQSAFFAAAPVRKGSLVARYKSNMFDLISIPYIQYTMYIYIFVFPETIYVISVASIETRLSEGFLSAA